MINQLISSAVKIAGSQQKLADACGVKQPSVYAWLHKKKRVSPENAKRIEIATNGVVKAYEIRPDLKELFPHPDAA